MFVDNSFNVKTSFIEDTKKYLYSSMEKLNFHHKPEEQRQYINNWVLGKTNNKIKDLFPQGYFQYILFNIMYKKFLLSF